MEGDRGVRILGQGGVDGGSEQPPPELGRIGPPPDEIRDFRRVFRAAHKLFGLEFEAQPAGRGGKGPDDRPDEAASREAGDLPVPAGRLVGLVRVVPGEQLVPSVPGQGDGDVLSGQLGDHVGRDDGGVGQGLVQEAGQRRNEAADFGRGDDEGAVIGPELAGHDPGGVELVERFFPEADGVRLDPRPGDLAHQGGDGAGIDAAAEKDAEGDVGDEPAPDGFPEPVDDLRRVFGRRAGDNRRFGVADVPVGKLGFLPVLENEQAAGQDFPDPAEDRARGRNVLESEEPGQGLEVDVPGNRGLEEGLDLGGEIEPRSDPAIMERFDSQAVAGQDEAAAFRVPEDDGEHPVEGVDEIRSPFLVKMNDDFGIGLRGQDMAPGEEILADLGEIIDFPVHHDPDRPVLVGHRLVTGDEVDDAQAAHPQGGLSIDMEALVVGPAVDQGAGHPLEKVRGAGVESPAVDESADAAHGVHFKRIRSKRPQFLAPEAAKVYPEGRNPG